MHAILSSMHTTVIRFAVPICFLCLHSYAFTAKPIEIVEVMHRVPTIEISQWRIGDSDYEIDLATVVDTEHKPILGNLAIVAFEKIEGINLAIKITPLAISSASVSDGPYIFIDKNNQLTSITMRNGLVHKNTLLVEQEITPIQTTIPSVPTIKISSLLTAPAENIFPMPKKLLALSDIEGNLEHLITFLQFHTVIDAEFKWSWGKNHLLFNGDSVDRGDHVTELLWFMRELQRQAINAGGNVHVVLGNHEAMILANDIRYTHPKYKFVAQRIGIPYHALFGEQSILGDWLRAQNAIVQVGKYLFVHAGYGPELDALQLTKEEINISVRKNLGPPAWTDRTALDTSLVWHSKGPLWYRGYFVKHGESYGPKPTSKEIEAILTRNHASTIVVGHTVTGTIGWLDGDKRLIGIDVHWDTIGEGQGLLISDGQQIRVTMTETDAELEYVSTAKN